VLALFVFLHKKGVCGFFELSFSMHFTLFLDPPKLPSNLTKYKEIIEGSPVVIRCPASGTPQPLITWYKDGLLITGDHGGLAILDDGSLEILDAEAEDSSVYTCIAENQAGEVEHDVEVKVIGKSV
jgi:hypothetical protein